MPGVAVWVAAYPPSDAEKYALRNSLGVDRVEYVKVVSRTPSPAKVVAVLKRFLGAGKVYAVLAVPFSTLAGVLDILSRNPQLMNRIEVLVPEIEVLGATTVQQLRASGGRLPPGVHAACGPDGRCLVYRIVAFREVRGVQLYGRRIPVQLYA